MRKLFTLLAMGFFLLSANAQSKQVNPVDVALGGKVAANAPVPNRAKNSKSAVSGRSTTSAFSISYRANEEAWADEKGYTNTGYIWEMNGNLPNESFATLRNMAVLFDSLQENTDDFQSYKVKFYPKAKSTVKVSAVYFPAIFQKNASNKPDTFKVSLFKLPANYAWTNPSLAGLISGSGVNESLNSEPTTIWADSSYNFNPSDWALDSVSSPNGTVYFLGRENMNVQLQQGETFGFRVDFKGDTANKLVVYAGYHERCQDTAFAVSAIIPNSVGYMNFKVNASTNLSGVYRDDIVYNVQPPCNRFLLQNFTMYADVEVTNDNFSVAVVPSVTEACPGSQVDLKANFVGSSEATFVWSSKTGTLSSTNDEEVTLTLATTNQNDTVTLIGTDSTGLVNDTSVFIVKNNGIGVNFANSPYSVNCGAKANAVSALSGYTTGQRTFQWNIDTDPLVDSTTTSGNMGGLLPGNYSVTVTNSKGCQSSASFSVQYNNGVANNVNFTTPDVIAGGAAQVCINLPYTYNNTSSNKDGWEASWAFGDANGSTDVATDAFFAYTATGTYRVTLSMDSAGCKFVGPEKSVQVLPATNAACSPNSVNEISFEQSVELMPNPTNGLVTINVSNLEKGISIQVFNILGSEVKQFTSKDVNGTFSKSFDYSDLSKGAYLVKIQSGSKVAVKRMIVNK
jgi:hypothetical protein